MPSFLNPGKATLVSMPDSPDAGNQDPGRGWLRSTPDPSALVAGLGAILFLAILVDVQAGGFLSSRVDPWVRSMLGFEGGLLYQAAALTTRLGAWLVLGPVGLLAVYLTLRDRRVVEGLLIAISLLAQAGLVQLTKFLVGRARPGDAGLDAFPSGHAANGLLVWGLLLLIAIPQGVRDKRAYAVFVPLAFLAGFTRILIDVHWTTDVLAGWSLGAAWLAATILVRDRSVPAAGADVPRPIPSMRAP